MSLFREAAASRTLQRLAEGSSASRWWSAAPEPCRLWEGSLLLSVSAKSRVLTSWGLLLTVLVLAAASAYTSQWTLFFLTALGVAAFALPNLALGILPSVLIWTPRLPLLGTGDEILFLRCDHALVLGLGVRLVTDARWRPPCCYSLAPLALFMCAVSGSIVWGTLRGALPSPAGSLLYLAQTAELAVVLVLGMAAGRALRHSGIYWWAFPVLLAAGYGIAERLFPVEPVPGVYRTFERGWFVGQANHMAGLFATAAVFGIGLARDSRWRVLGLGLACAACAGLAGAHSREGIVAAGAGMAVLAWSHRPSLRLWMMGAALLAAAWLMTRGVFVIAEPGSSMAERLTAWKSALDTLPSHLLLGLGFGARHRSFYDNYYVLLVAESGLVGLTAFLFWLSALVRDLRVQVRNSTAAAIPIAALAALAALTVQALACSAFLVTVLAGPACWLIGWALTADDESCAGGEVAGTIPGVKRRTSAAILEA